MTQSPGSRRPPTKLVLKARRSEVRRIAVEAATAKVDADESVVEDVSAGRAIRTKRAPWYRQSKVWVPIAVAVVSGLFLLCATYVEHRAPPPSINMGSVP